MSTTVYLIGHGRVERARPVSIPKNITMHWLARIGDITSGLSNAFLSGCLTKEHGTDGPGARIREHHLCGDLEMTLDPKIKDFFSRTTPDPNGSDDPCVLYTRPQTDVSLSSIFDFLLMLSPTNEWHVYWTCCRGYIGKVNPYKTLWSDQGTIVRELRDNPDPTPALGTQDHKIKKADFNSVVFVAKSDRRSVNRVNIASPAAAARVILKFDGPQNPGRTSPLI
jgi:hypothetical protein